MPAPKGQENRAASAARRPCPLLCRCRRRAASFQDLYGSPGRSPAALPSSANMANDKPRTGDLQSIDRAMAALKLSRLVRSEEHTSELQSLMRTSYAVFCLKKKKTNNYI